jgi:hypothetical protein
MYNYDCQEYHSELGTVYRKYLLSLNLLLIFAAKPDRSNFVLRAEPEMLIIVDVLLFLMFRFSSFCRMTDQN